MKKVSIIVPIYNVSKYLDECINSLLKQTYENLEVILVDDGSTDGSYELCKLYAKKDKRVKAFHKENGGVSSARNFGLDNATGDYISFVDSDDYLNKNCVSFCIDVFEKQKVDFVCFSAMNYYDKIPYVKFKNDLAVLNKSKIFKEYLRLGCGVCDKIFKSSLWSNYRFENYNINEDVLAMYEILKKVNTIAITSNCYYFYRQRSDSASHSKTISMVPYEINLEIIEDYEKKYSNNDKYIYARFIYTCIDTYNRIILYDVNNSNLNKIICGLKKYKMKLYSNERISFIKKIQLFLLLHFKKLYKLIIKIKKAN